MDANIRVPFPPPTVKPPGTCVFLFLQLFLMEPFRLLQNLRSPCVWYPRRRLGGKLNKHPKAMFCSASLGFSAPQYCLKNSLNASEFCSLFHVTYKRDPITCLDRIQRRGQTGMEKRFPSTDRVVLEHVPKVSAQ